MITTDGVPKSHNLDLCIWFKAPPFDLFQTLEPVLAQSIRQHPTKESSHRSERHTESCTAMGELMVLM